tara:strand:- start:1319 stop:1477 length:159 start_codon:yes stop_codon:yes gene_type:complete
MKNVYINTPTTRLISHKEAYEANRAIITMREETEKLRAILAEYYGQNPVKLK